MVSGRVVATGRYSLLLAKWCSGQANKKTRKQGEEVEGRGEGQEERACEVRP